MYTWTCILVEGSRSGTYQVFHKDHQSKNELHINFLAFQFHNLNGAVAYHPRQRWAYYSFQNTKEVAIFVIDHLCHHFCSLSWIIFSSLFFVSGHLCLHLCSLHWSSFHPPGTPFPPLHARQVLCKSPHIFPKHKLSKRSRQSCFSGDSGCLVFLTYLYFEPFCISDLNKSIFSTILNFNTLVFLTWPILNWFLRAVSCFYPKNSAQSNIFERVSVFRWPRSHLTFKVAKSSRLFFSWPGPD